MSRIEKISNKFEDLGINPEVIRVYTNLRWWVIQSFTWIKKNSNYNW